MRTERPAAPKDLDELRGRILVALDLPSASEALTLVKQLEGSARFFKVGLELWADSGPELVHRLREQDLEVFVDLKLCDIPATVERATRRVAALGARLLTIHEPPSSVAGAVRGRGEGALRLLGVTYLTSMSEDEVRLIHGLPEGVDLGAATLAKARRLVEAGCDGVVCSPLELAPLRAALPGSILLAPGIRPEGSEAFDQRRVASPAEAMAAGADYLVVGRPVRDATDPRAAFEAIAEDAARGLGLA